MKIRNKKEYKNIRSHLRRTMTAPELVLWQTIRNKALGVKFRRQFSVENYIIDFYSPEIKLAIEIDGDSHYQDGGSTLKDILRDKNLLTRYGITTLRFTNRDVIANLESVVDKMLLHLPPLDLPLNTGEKK